MVTDKQVRRLLKLRQKEDTLFHAASKSGMSDNTARKYIKTNTLPSEQSKEHTWRTRKDPFEKTWEEVKTFLEGNSGLEAKTIFQYLQRTYPGQHQDGEIRTLQRKIKRWRALEGPAKEVFFPQDYPPGKVSESDFTHMSDLSVTIGRKPFDHMFYHFVLPYSNWETGTLCFSESFESLSEGLQNALWELGGVPSEHKTDQLTAAVYQLGNSAEFTQRYLALLAHYKTTGRKIQVRKPNENGDVEQSHYRFKKAIDQSLLLRGNRDFPDRESYLLFVRGIFKQLNAGRTDRLKEELASLKSLPNNRLDNSKRIKVKVTRFSTINIQHNSYSLPSRLIGECVFARIYAEHIDIYYAQKQIECLPRLRGQSKHYVNYRHIIDWLIRKPGAFENYRYRSDLFPSSNFRIAYDLFVKKSPSRGHKDYLALLKLAAKGSESAVEQALRQLMIEGAEITVASVKALTEDLTAIPDALDVSIDAVDLTTYDELLPEMEDES